MKSTFNPKMILPLALALSALVGCSAKKGSGNGAASDTSATTVAASGYTVDTATFNRAVAVINGIDYLPFFNYGSGCEDRARFMGLELAANKIAGNTITVKALPHTTPIWPKKLIKTRLPAEPLTGHGGWSYHVAVSFNVKGTEMVIDPALSLTPVTSDQWLALMGTVKKDVYLWYSPFTEWAGPMSRGRDAKDDTRSANLADFSRINENDVLPLAGMMAYKLIQEGDNWSAADKAEAQREHDKLFARTMEIRDILVKQGLMIGEDAGSEMSITKDSLDQAEEDAPESD